MHIKSSWRRPFDAVMMALFPYSCGGCNQPLSSRPQYLLCPLCAAAIADNPDTETISLPANGKCYAPYLYGGPLENMIWAAKFRGRSELNWGLAHLILAAPNGSNIIKGVDLIAPIPLSPIRHFQRGYNQSEEIALVLSKHSQIPMHRGWRRSHRQSQHKLRRDERLINLVGAFQRPQGIENKRVLLIDDVVTTGATLQEAAKALLQAGAASVDAIAVAQSNWSYPKS